MRKKKLIGKKLNWEDIEEVTSWAQGDECRKYDLSFLNHNANNFNPNDSNESVIGYNFIEKGMRVRSFMHSLKDDQGVSELEKYNEASKITKRLYQLKKASPNELFNSNLPEQNCIAFKEVQDKFKKAYSLTSTLAKTYQRAFLNKEPFIAVSDNKVVEDLVTCRLDISKEKYQEERDGREMPARLESTLEKIHRDSVQKYLNSPNWYFGDPGQVRTGASSSTSSSNQSTRQNATGNWDYADADQARVNTGASASTSSSNQSTPQNVTGKGKGKNPKFGSISLSINEFGKAAQNSQQQNKNVESICIGVPPVRPEILNTDRYFSSHQLVPSIILLAGAFFIAIFYKIKNSKKPG